MTHHPTSPVDFSTNPPIEPWQLTAYALHELEADDAQRVEQALSENPALQRELEQIQSALASVRLALTHLPPHAKLDDDQAAAVAHQIEQSVAPNLTASLKPVQWIQPPFYRRKRFAALLATAAAIPLAATWGPLLWDGEKPFAFKDSNSEFSVPSSPPILATPLPATPVPATPVPSPSAAASAGPVIVDDFENTERAAISPSPDAIASNTGLIEETPKKVEEILSETERDDVLQRSEITKKALQTQLAELRKKEDKWVDHYNSVEKMPSEKQAGEKQAGEKQAPFQQDNKKTSGQQIGDVKREIDGDIEVAAKPADPVSPPSPISAPAAASGYGSTLSGSAGGYGGVSGRSYGGGSGGGYGGGYSGEIAGLAKDSKSLDEVPHARGVVDESPRFQAMPIPLSVKDSESARGGVPNSKERFRAAAPGYGMPMALSALDERTGNDRLLAESKAPSFVPSGDVDLLTDLPESLRANVRSLGYKRQDRQGTDRFEKIVETPFVETQKAPLSTFSIDVDTASYSKIRQTLMEGNRLPSPSMVRIEEMVNYFEYEYAGPQDGRPFASHMIVDRCPWNPEHQLVRIGLQAKKIDSQTRTKANIVFLLDVSGSMNEPNKLPLVKKSLAMMVNQLTENDRVAIVVYAGAAGCVLPSTCGIDKQRILSALDHLEAGGSTNGGQGIQLAYAIAKEHFVPGGANRVVLCTDGDFNVGVTGDDALVAMMQENAKSNIFLTCLGFGAGNYNDTMMEKISNKGNGIYGMIDNELEGRRMMVEQLGGTLVTVAKDVKIQVDFNAANVAGYRLIGYEDRRLANKDFSDDKKDAGEIGAGHRVTALYEVIPAGKWVGGMNPSEGEVSKYAKKPAPPIEAPASSENASELLTLRVRYKEPEGSESTLQEFVLKRNDANDLNAKDRLQVDRDMRWATAVAEFGLLLRRSEMAPNANWSDMLERATHAAGGDPYRLECLSMMRKAMSMMR